MKRLGSILCALAVCLSFAVCLADGSGTETYENGIYLYRIDGDGNALIVALKEDYRGTLMIADELDGHPVTGIGDGAMADRDGITGVMIPSSVKEIGAYAFCGCDGLKIVYIRDGVKKVGVSAFMFCRNLSSVTVGETVTELSAHAFCGCVSLEAIRLPSSVSAIGDQCFSDCSDSLTLSAVEGSFPAVYCAENGIRCVFE